MALSDTQRKLILDFRTWVETHAAAGLGAGAPERQDREDDSTLATRWAGGEQLWYELTVRPFLPQVRVGVLTDDRWKSEEFEQKIEDSGDTMSEFLEVGFETAGLTWASPPVEHYREHGKYFYFATPLELGSLDDLAGDAVRLKAVQMLEGYRHAFGRPE